MGTAQEFIRRLGAARLLMAAVAAGGVVYAVSTFAASTTNPSELIIRTVERGDSRIPERQNTPLGGVNVTVKPGCSSKQFLTSQAAGQQVLRCKPGKYQVVAQVPAGFAAVRSSTQDVRVEKGKRARVDFQFQRGSVRPTPSPTPSGNPSVTFETYLEGNQSRIQNRTDQVIKSAGDWQRLQQEAGITDIRGNIDFSREMLIATFMGRQPSGGHDTGFLGIVEQADKLIATVAEQRPASNCRTTDALTAPFHVIKLARSDKPVEFITTYAHLDCLAE